MKSAFFCLFVVAILFGCNVPSNESSEASQKEEPKKAYEIISSYAGPANEAGISRVLLSVTVSPEVTANLEELKQALGSEQNTSEYQMYYVFEGEGFQFSGERAASTNELIEIHRKAKVNAKAVIHIPPTGEGFIE